MKMKEFERIDAPLDPPMHTFQNWGSKYFSVLRPNQYGILPFPDFPREEPTCARS